MGNDYILDLDQAYILLRLSKCRHIMSADIQSKLDQKIDEVIKRIDPDSTFDMVACFAEFLGKEPENLDHASVYELRFLNR